MRYLAEHPEFDVTLVDVEDPYHRVRHKEQDLSRFDGFIEIPQHMTTTQMKKSQIVNFGILHLDDYDNILQVGIDDALISQAAADLLLRRGYGNFAYVGINYPKIDNELRFKWGNDNLHSARRQQAFEERLAENGHTCNSHVFNTMRPDTSIRVLSRFLESLPKPCGVLTYNDALALNVYNACRLARLSIPDQIAVVGVDNDAEVCEMLRPTLTSILPDFEFCGYLAIETLLQKIEHPERPVPNRMVGIRRIFERESTQDVDGAVRLVTRARAYIETNFDRHLTVPEIAASVKTSRRLLEMKFRQVTNGTIHDEIEHVRMEEAKRLLTRTNHPIGEIAAACGFSSDISFRFAFKRAIGVAPQAYRNQPNAPR